MEFRPIGITNFATRTVTASISSVANFLAIPVVPTASFALNIAGPSGPSGSSTTIIGLQGPQGPQGPSGSKGRGIYLLSDTRVTCSVAFSLGFAVAPFGTEEEACNATPSTYYSDTSPLGLGVSLYTNQQLTNTATAGYYSDGSTVWSYDGGIIDNTGNTCTGGGGDPPPGGGGCTGTCGMGTYCSVGCECSVDEEGMEIGFCQEPQEQ